jgi:hypothetical protein
MIRGYPNVRVTPFTFKIGFDPPGEFWREVGRGFRTTQNDSLARIKKGNHPFKGGFSSLRPWPRTVII